jgi:hypothetical protein
MSRISDHDGELRQRREMTRAERDERDEEECARPHSDRNLRHRAPKLSPSTRRGLAPNAMRIPISRDRRSTVNAVTA